jgi:hypothetical protein
MSSVFTVVGFRFRPGKPQPGCLVGKEIQLVSESTNQHDPNAIKVMVDNKHVAYVTRLDCDDVKKIMDCGNYSISVLETFRASARCVIAKV